MSNQKEEKLPYRILGEYRPEVFDERTIGFGLLALVRQAGFSDVSCESIRGPFWHNLYADGRRPWAQGGDADWHHDGCGETGLVLWSSKSPTQIKRKDSNGIFQPEPYQVVLIRNLAVLHRRHGDMKDRWFARLLVSLKPGDLE